MTWPQAIYLAVLIVVVACLARGQFAGHINLWDLVTATDRNGVARTDGRKFFEVGAFVVSTVAFSYLVVVDNLTEVFLTVYMGAWVTARYLRDREQRLHKAIELGIPAKPDTAK